MANVKLVSEVVKRRARRVFEAIDNGIPLEEIRQAKLRVVTKKRLYYNWRAHSNPLKRKHTPQGFRAFLMVWRDSLNRVYVKEVEEIPLN